MELESCAEREGLNLLMTANEPSKVHLRQWVGEARAHEEQDAKERSRACCLGSQMLAVFEGGSCRGGVRSSSWVERVCTEFMSLIWGRTKEKMKCRERSVSFSSEGARWQHGDGPFGAEEHH